MRLHRLTTPPVVLTAVAAAVVALTLSTSSAAPATSRSAGSSSPAQVHLSKAVPTASQWNAAWRASPQAPSAGSPGAVGLTDQTVRMIVRSDVTGNTVRVRLSNGFGASAVRIGKADVAHQTSGPDIAASSDRALTFAGHTSVTIPVGKEVVSDPVKLNVKRGQNLVVSAFFPDATGPTTWHFEAETTSYISTPGDWTAQPGGSPYQTITPSWFYLDGVDVLSHPVKGTIVAFGDSITDGHYSTVDANGRWPDWLARRIPSYSVINEGIGGNQLLADTSGSGISGLHRLSTDALNQPGVTSIILLEGINDIDSDATAAELITGMKHVIARAHARCISVFGGTLTPDQGSSSYTLARESEREALNTWIRTSGAFDGVVDFDAAVRDPNNPLALDPKYDTGGGHLHPNDLGYEAMGNAVNLAMLKHHYTCSSAAGS
jgi:lysophospholipase L1-like esterase